MSGAPGVSTSNLSGGSSVLEIGTAEFGVGRWAKAVIYEHGLAGAIAFVHPADLWNAGVRFIDDGEEIVWKKIDYCVGPRARCAPGQVARIIFNPIAEPHFLQHFQVVLRAHAQPLRLQQFVLRFEFDDALLKLLTNGAQRAIQLVRRGHELFRRKKCDDIERFVRMTR